MEHVVNEGLSRAALAAWRLPQIAAWPCLKNAASQHYLSNRRGGLK
jgi:hypothetical protein